MKRSPLAFSLGVALALAGCGGGNTSTTDGGSGNCVSGQLSFDGLCVTPPSLEAERTACGDVTEFCDKGGTKAPSLACLTDAPKMHPATPASVTLTGFVHPFSGGKSNVTVSVQVYRAADLATGIDIAAASPIAQKEFAFDPATASDATQFRACDVDPTIGCIPVDPAACKSPVCNDGLSGRMDDNKYCKSVGGQGVCADRLRWERRYALDNIPTNTPLVIRTSGEKAAPSSAWNTLVQWNVFLASDDKSCGGDLQATDCLDTSDNAHPKYQLNVNVLSQADYVNIPTSAGLAGGISAGLGGMAGEIHDCDNIRVANVQIAVKPAGDRLTYFNGNPFKTLPDASRALLGTDRLGLYASLNIKPGKVFVEAVGQIGGKPATLGSYTAFVYPGTVSVVNINGGKPRQ